MDNTYIQNKLDEISKKFTTNIILSLSLPDEMIDYVERTINKNIEQAITEAYNKGQTDYHNHIVEKVKGMERKAIKNFDTSYYVENSNGYNEALSNVLAILQDTNPKE